MAHNFGARCKDCGGEDCPCCEVYLEWQADQRAAPEQEEPDPYEDDSFGEED